MWTAAGRSARSRTQGSWLGDGDVKLFKARPSDNMADVMASFREMVSQAQMEDRTIDDERPGFLCFQVKLEHHKQVLLPPAGPAPHTPALSPLTPRCS